MGYGRCSYFLDDLAIPAHGVLHGWPRWLRVLNDVATPVFNGGLGSFFDLPNGTVFALGETTGAQIGLYSKPPRSQSWALHAANVDDDLLYQGISLPNGKFMLTGGGGGLGFPQHTYLADSNVDLHVFAPPGDLEAVDPANEFHSGLVYNQSAIVLAYLNQPRVAVSLDLGVTWALFAVPLPYKSQPALGVGQAGRIFMVSGGQEAIRTSDDNGATWQTRLFNTGSLFAVAASFGVLQTVVAAGAGVWLSQNNGDTWVEQVLPDGLPTVSVKNIVRLPGGRFLSIGPPGNGNPPRIPGGFAQLLISDANGENWRSVPSSLDIQQGGVTPNEFSPGIFHRDGILYACGNDPNNGNANVSVSPDFRF